MHYIRTEGWGDTNMQQLDRSKIIDIAKGIGIMLVVLGHLNTPLCPFVYQFHMPLFFFISGWLFKDTYLDAKRVFCEKRAKSLLIPYVFFYVVAFLFLPHDQASWKDIFSIKYAHNILGTFWFLRELLKSSLLILFFAWLLRRICNWKIILPAILFFLVHLLNWLGVDGLSHTLYFAFFFSVGIMVKSSSSGGISLKFQYVASLGCFLVVLGLSQRCHLIVSTTTWKTFALYAVGAFAGIYLTFFMSRIVEKARFVSIFFVILGRYTMPIMIFHFSIFFVIDYVKEVFGVNELLLVIDAPVKLLAGVFIPIIIGTVYNYLKNRFVYPLFERVFGSSNVVRKII